MATRVAVTHIVFQARHQLDGVDTSVALAEFFVLFTFLTQTALHMLQELRFHVEVRVFVFLVVRNAVVVLIVRLIGRRVAPRFQVSKLRFHGLRDRRQAKHVARGLRPILYHFGGAQATPTQPRQLDIGGGFGVKAPNEIPNCSAGLVTPWGVILIAASSPRFLARASSLANLPM